MSAFWSPSLFNYMKSLKYKNMITSTAENIHKKHTCPICISNFDVGESVITLVCDHIFHEKCISEWLKVKKNCPLCRKTVKNSNDLSSLLFFTEESEFIDDEFRTFIDYLKHK